MFKYQNMMVILFVVVLLCHFPFISTASLDSDKEALMSFRSQISVDPSNPLSSWDPNMSPCNWTGVSCGRFGHRVVSLNLSKSTLSGTISPHIGNLSFLRSLQLQNNELSGTIPTQICNLRHLQFLNLSANNLAGPIPSNITRLVKLQVLDLMMNKITGRIPQELGSLTKLRVMSLGKNSLAGEIPSSIGNLSSLSTLSLGTNYLSGPIPSVLTRIRALKVLDLTINNLTGTVPPSIYNMSSLINLALASNDLWGKPPYNVGETLPNLLVFNFCFNKFTGTIPGSLHNLTNIQIIRMAHNLLEGTVPPGLEKLPSLKMYNIGYNKITNSDGRNDIEYIITSLTNSTQLNFLAFDGNSLEGTIPESLGNMSKVLLKLYMGGNRIHGGIPSSIGHLSSLTLLNLSDNAITGEIPSEISKLQSLQMLGLARNQMSGSIPSFIGSLRKLNQLDLSGNNFVGKIPNTFGNLNNLISMDLSRNRLNGTIPIEIFSLKTFTTTLNLSNNFIDGQLPQEIGLLEMVTTIDLSNNRLLSNIPSSIKGCKSLEGLYLAKNQFSGSIPTSLGEVKALELLDLSHNQLFGTIPASLQQLEALQYLNLAFNNLEGGIPCKFRNLSQSSIHLEGNPKMSTSYLPCDVAQGNHNRRRKMHKVIYLIAGIAVMLALCTLLGSFYFYRKKGKAKVLQDKVLAAQKRQMVKYDELRRATADFNEENLIGKGSFGSVYKGYLGGHNVAVAIKVLDMGKIGSRKSFVAECEALRNIRHRNLVKLITSCSSLDSKNTEFLALVFEFVANGSLDDWIKGKRQKRNGEGLNFMERLNVAIDIASALDYLHHDYEAPIVHCDLKPSNILLNEDMTAKIGDFGLARLLVDSIGDQPSISSTHVLKGSIGYMPPEYGLGAKPSTAGDAYSFGVTLLELFTGKSPTHENFKAEQNLIGWVQSASSSPNMMKVLLDPVLLPMINSDHQHRNLGHDHPMRPEKQHDCFSTILEVGQSCTMNHAEGRISMRDALRKLRAARNTLLKS